jgi:ABC-2 type transport system permease protein
MRVGAMNELQYRINFFVKLVQSLIALGTGVAALLLVFSYTNSLRGWGEAELLVVMGVHIFMGGVLSSTIEPNMQRIMGDVQQGTLDYILTKPGDSQILVSIREFRLWQAVDVVLGLIVMTVGLARYGPQVGPLPALGFAVALVLGALMIYAVWLILTTGAFWLVQIDNVFEIYRSFYQAGRWPVGIYPDWLRLGLTFLIPVAFAVTVPAEALTGRLTLATLAGAAVLALVFLLAARWVWFRGLANYSGASA